MFRTSKGTVVLTSLGITLSLCSGVTGRSRGSSVTRFVSSGGSTSNGVGCNMKEFKLYSGKQLNFFTNKNHQGSHRNCDPPQKSVEQPWIRCK